MELRAWRHKKGLTLKQACPYFGISYSTLSRYEKRERKTICSTIVEIIFEKTGGYVTPNDLYGYTKQIIREARNAKKVSN